MLTPYGVYVRKLRLDRELRLLDMANMLERSSTYISAIETGRKPIPEGFITEVAEALSLSPEAREELLRAADQTRKKMRIGALRGEERELVAAFARRVHNASEADLQAFREFLEINKGVKLKMVADQAPFSRTRRGHLVPARRKLDIWALAEKVRGAFIGDDIVEFPIIAVLEHHLPRLRPGFYMDVMSRDELDGDEARTEPARNVIILARDVYESACRGDGRARFTASHELGHLMLHNSVSFARPSNQFPIYRDSEWQADTFAGALLMPVRQARKFDDEYDMASACKTTYQAAEVMWAKYVEEELI